MKKRIDFVTNSSSSSFVIAYKPIEFSKEVTQKYPEVGIIDKLVNAFFGSEGEYGETCAGEIVKTITELHNYFEFEYGKDFAEDKYVLNLYNESKRYVTNGYTVVFKSIDYHDSASRDMLYDLSENLGSKFIILEDD